MALADAPKFNLEETVNTVLKTGKWKSTTFIDFPRMVGKIVVLDRRDGTTRVLHRKSDEEQSTSDGITAEDEKKSESGSDPSASSESSSTVVTSSLAAPSDGSSKMTIQKKFDSHWSRISFVLQILAETTDEMVTDESSLTLTLLKERIALIEAEISSGKTDPHKMDMPGILKELLNDSEAVDKSLLIRVLALCTQKMMFGAVHKMMTEVLPKEDGMEIGRLGDRSWDIEIEFSKDELIRIKHNRVGCACKGIKDREYLVHWIIELSILVNSEDVSKSKCTNALLRIEKVEFTDPDGVDAHWKSVVTTALGGGFMHVH